MEDSLPDPKVVDRQTGILNEKDRKYLLDHSDSDIEPGSNAERKIRRRIREKCKHAILDFSILVNELEHRDRAQIFPSAIRDSNAPIWRGMVDAFAFMFYGDGELIQRSIRRSTDPDVTVGGEIKQASEVDEYTPGFPVRWLVVQALTGAGNRAGYVIRDIELDYSAEQIQPDQMIERLKHGQNLSIEEICYYLNQLEETGRCDSQELQEILGSYFDQEPRSPQSEPDRMSDSG